jgi:hypothetical protein
MLLLLFHLQVVYDKSKPIEYYLLMFGAWGKQKCRRQQHLPHQLNLKTSKSLTNHKVIQGGCPHHLFLDLSATSPNCRYFLVSCRFQQAH